MDKATEKKPLSGTLKLKIPKATASNATETAITKSSAKIKIIATPSALEKTKPNFNAIYNQLHEKFPITININKPVLLAVGICKEMSKHLGISSTLLRKWIAWYCRKSKYYVLHKQDAIRFNLDGSEAGRVTAIQQANMERIFNMRKTVDQ